MIDVMKIERKSAVLTPSSLACLSHMPTINLTAGCAHGCLYCYTRGYTNYPGTNKVAIYANTLAKLQEELPRKRKKPKAVYFSPSSDLFQPIPELLDLTYDILHFLLNAGIGVAFVTKGEIPKRHRKLLIDHAELVSGQIGIITLDPDITAVFEPYTAPPYARLAQMEELIKHEIAIDARLDPILPGLTDDEDSLDSLCKALTQIGIRNIAASVLFLRPAVAIAFKRHIQDKVMLDKLLGAFSDRARLSIHAGNSEVFALPQKYRLEILERLEMAAARHGLRVHVCTCKNPDISTNSCNISGSRGPTNNPKKPSTLF
jgi:DNA repair photolyase